MVKISFSKSCKKSILYKQIFKEINDLVLDSIPIVSILSFFIGGVVAIQMALNLESPLLSKTLIGFATRQSVILEFAPTFISIIMAGKVGSYITSSIGTMRVTEQIDALEVMGINSLNYLVFPKIIAMLLYPFIITISMFLGIIGGLLAMTLTGVPSEAYIEGIQTDFDGYHVTYSYVKTLVFPVPAPARTSTAPSTASTASSCFEFNPCKYPTLDVLPASLALDLSSAFMSGIYAIIPACK